MNNCEEPWICARETATENPSTQESGLDGADGWETGERASAVSVVGVVESLCLCVVY